MFQGGEKEIVPKKKPDTLPTEPKGIREIANVADKLFEKTPILRNL